MPKRRLGLNVLDSALDRYAALYKQGHRVVVSMSGGKDSTVCLELAVIAAKKAGKLPVEVTMRDEEISYPGTYEFCERMAQRPEIDFHWWIQNHPIINIFNRAHPYFWAFDPLLDPKDWVRQPPPYAKPLNRINMEAISDIEVFPPPKGKDLFAVVGLRTQESHLRGMALASSKGAITKKNRFGCRRFFPIYDWSDGDVWKAIKDFGWDYNSCYDVMAQMGLPHKYIRVAPPTMSAASLTALTMSMKAWPRWFDKVDERCPGSRSAAMFGRRAVEPIRTLGETWEDTFYRTCIKEAPDWIAKRSSYAIDKQLAYHARHSSNPFPEKTNCARCAKPRSWREAAMFLYMGDPFGMKCQWFSRTTGEMALQGAIPPEYFRKGAGDWGKGRPAF